MPIRSPKGRSAAYRSIWQWPLRSPTRLVGCLVLLVALGVGLNAVTGLISRRPSGVDIFGSPASAVPGATAVPKAAPPTSAPTRLPPVVELAPPVLPLSAVPAQALTVATRWTQAWATHPPGTTTEAWVDRLRPYTTDEYLAVLATVDPTNVPATRVQGTARAVAVSPRSARIEVPTDALTLLILVINTGSEWRVAGYDRASTAEDPGKQAPRRSTSRR